MIVSVSNGDKGLLYDADGLQIDKCIEANLDTGECVCLAVDDAGKVIVQEDEAKKNVIMHKPPLRFEPK